MALDKQKNENSLRSNSIEIKGRRVDDSDITNEQHDIRHQK